MNNRTHALVRLSRLAIWFAITPLPVFGQAGSLDPTFGSSGIVTSHVQVFPGAATVDASGNILIAGTAAVGQPGQIVRFLVDGELDTTFGKNGVVTTFTPLQMTTIRVQADGKVLAAGFTNGEDTNGFFALARFNRDGSPDTSFGTHGLVVTLFAPPVTGGGIERILEQPDGKILAAGGNVAGVLVRYNPDGSLDESFGNGGIVQGPPHSTVITILALQADGSILFTWAASLGLLELSADGVLEPKTKVGTIIAVAGTIQRNGDILESQEISQDSKAPTRQEVQLKRFLPSGTPDPAFNNPLFYWQTEPPADLDLSFITAVTFPSTSRIVAGGFSTTAGGGVFALGRFTETGGFDPTFGNAGIVTTKILDNCGITLVVVQPDGKTVAIGLASNDGAPTSDLALARYLSE